MIIALAMVAMMGFGLVACTTGTTDTPPATDTPATDTPATDTPAPPATGTGKVGVSMPTQDLQRWNQDGENMKQQLEAAGFEVILQFAGNDVATQVSQIENMIAQSVDVLVIAAIDGESLGTPLAEAQQAGIHVIAYDRLIMGTDAVSFYATFDNFNVGVKQGEFIRDMLDLENSPGPYNIEIFTGDPGDNNARFFYDGAMSIIQPFIDSGVLNVPSNQISFMEVATADWSTANAQSRMENILSSFYAGGTILHAVLCSNDSTALGVVTAIQQNYAGDNIPWVTGQDCDIANMKNMFAGLQQMNIFKDTRMLAAQVVVMITDILAGNTPETNDNETYDNGVKVVPTYLIPPVLVTIDNAVQILVDSGYYTAEEIGAPAN